MGEISLSSARWTRVMGQLVECRVQGRIEAQRFCQVLFSFGVLAQTQPRQSAVGVSNRVRGIEFNCAVEIGDGSIQIVLVIPNGGSTVISESQTRVELNR